MPIHLIKGFDDSAAIQGKWKLEWMRNGLSDVHREKNERVFEFTGDKLSGERCDGVITASFKLDTDRGLKRIRFSNASCQDAQGNVTPQDDEVFGYYLDENELTLAQERDQGQMKAVDPKKPGEKVMLFKLTRVAESR